MINKVLCDFDDFYNKHSNFNKEISSIKDLVLFNKKVSEYRDDLLTLINKVEQHFNEELIDILNNNYDEDYYYKVVSLYKEFKNELSKRINEFIILLNICNSIEYRDNFIKKYNFTYLELDYLDALAEARFCDLLNKVHNILDVYNILDVIDGDNFEENYMVVTNRYSKLINKIKSLDLDKITDNDKAELINKLIEDKYKYQIKNEPLKVTGVRKFKYNECFEDISFETNEEFIESYNVYKDEVIKDKTLNNTLLLVAVSSIGLFLPGIAGYNENTEIANVVIPTIFVILSTLSYKLVNNNFVKKLEGLKNLKEIVESSIELQKLDEEETSIVKK